MRRLLVAGLLWCAACKDPDVQQAEKQVETAAQLQAKGEAALAKPDPFLAIDFFRKAAQQTPTDANLYVLLAKAQSAAGDDASAVLAIAQAEELGLKNDPGLKRQRAELYRRMGQQKLAIATLLQLRDTGNLSPADLLDLASLQARAGQVDAGFVTLAVVQKATPDDIDAKVVEAEILLLSGEEVLAAKLMDRLLGEHPDLTAAHVLRARYFLRNGYAEAALQDLNGISADHRTDAEPMELKSRILLSLGRADDAARELEPLVTENPRNADLSAQLAEARLMQKRIPEAEELVDQALAVRPSLVRALYVRGRIREEQDDAKGAVDAYQEALAVDPAFAPALARMWPIHVKAGEKVEALAALEELLNSNHADFQEKLALAQLYAETGTQLPRAAKMVDDIIRQHPELKSAKELKVRIARQSRPVRRGGGQGGGVIIMKGGR